jgi:hypothetical protein
MNPTGQLQKVPSQRIIDPDGATVDIFPLPTDEANLEQLLRDLFEKRWQAITFGPLIQGAAWEMRAPHAPTYVGMLDGYLTVGFGASHFHLCIGPTRGRVTIRRRRPWPVTAEPPAPSSTAGSIARVPRHHGVCGCSTARASSSSPSCCRTRF